MSDYHEELKQRTIAQQRAKMETYHALRTMGLPIPQDLAFECRGDYNPEKFDEDGRWKD